VKAVASGGDSGCDGGSNPGIVDISASAHRLVASVATGRLQHPVGAFEYIFLVVPEIFGLPFEAVEFTLTLS
jgi:hypothetical protein